MTLLITIITNGLSGIALKSSASTSNHTGLAPWGIYCINPGGRVGFLWPSFLVASPSFLHFLLPLPSLLKALSSIKVLRSWDLLFLGPGLRFFDLWVFYWLALGTSFGCWQPTTPETVLVGVANKWAKPEGGFDFGIDCFFNYFFKTIKLSTALLHFDLHWKTKALPEVLNYCTFFWDTVQVKFN